MGALLQPLPAIGARCASSSKAVCTCKRVLPGLQTATRPPCCGPGVMGGGDGGGGGSQAHSAQSPRGASVQPGAFLVKIALEQSQLTFIFSPNKKLIKEKMKK